MSPIGGAILHACPHCQGRNLKILDKRLKAVWRMLTGSSRMLCRDCHITWRVHKPEVTSRVSRKGRSILPYHDENEWTMIVFPPGQWNQNMKRFLGTVDHLLENGCRRIKVDLSRPQSISSMFFGSLMASYKRCRLAGAEIRICRTPVNMREAFEATSLSFLLDEEIPSGE